MADLRIFLEKNDLRPLGVKFTLDRIQKAVQTWVGS
jgi:hypothetical protein